VTLRALRQGGVSALRKSSELRSPNGRMEGESRKIAGKRNSAGERGLSTSERSGCYPQKDVGSRPGIKERGVKKKKKGPGVRKGGNKR